MIDLRELRLGNWVKTDYSNEPVLEKQLDAGDLCWAFNVENGDHLEPIPISPEWLERCGLIKDMWGDYRLTDCFKLRKYQPNGYCVFATDDNETVIRIIEHVHTLQNIFYFLTGEELQIKEKTN